MQQHSAELDIQNSLSAEGPVGGTWLNASAQQDGIKSSKALSIECTLKNSYHLCVSDRCNGMKGLS